MNKETMKAYEQYIKKLPNDAVKKTVKEGDNEPLFFGKDQWQQDKQKSLNAYNAVKEQHDTMKANGITDEHRKQANKQLAKDNPSYHEKSKQAFLSIKLHQLAELDNLAKQHGADKHARAGQTYKGKIIQSDGKMSLQQTQDGIVLHRVGNLTVGKGYTLSHNDKTYSIQQDYEIRTKTNNKTKVRALESDFSFVFSIKKQDHDKKNSQNRVLFSVLAFFIFFNIFLKIFRHAVSLIQQGFASL